LPAVPEVQQEKTSVAAAAAGQLVMLAPEKMAAVVHKPAAAAAAGLMADQVVLARMPREVAALAEMERVAPAGQPEQLAG